MSSVSLVKIENNEFDKAISYSLDLIDYHFLKGVKNIAIKTNLCYYIDYTTGHTTDPSFVLSLAKVLREKISENVRIDIVESDASAMKCKHAFRMLGYEKIAKRYNLNLVNLSEVKCTKTRVSVGTDSFDFMIPSTIGQADLLINVAKMKYTMPSVKITCAMKNIFGCNPYPQKYKYHSKLGEVIVALNKVMKFHLNIIEGNIVFGEKTRKLGLVMASRDIVAIDAACAKIMGVPLRSLGYLSLAEKEKIGHRDFVATGVPLDYFVQRYPRHDYFSIVKDYAFYYLEKFGLTGKLGID